MPTFFTSLWQFSRPHTIIGTTLSVLALYLIAINQTDTTISQVTLVQGLLTWIACCCGNIYIVGLNQIFDIELDKINKPTLPLASGAFSLKQGQWIVGITGFLALAIAAYSGLWLFITVSISLLLGTVYSVPPIRLKRFPFLAAFCILSVRGVVVNLGLFLHLSQKFTGQALLTDAVEVLSLFIVIFTIAIAIFKDVPDLEGDKKFNIKTFTLVLGGLAIFKIARWVITVCYLGMIAFGLFWLSSINTGFFVLGHTILLGLLWWRSQGVNLNEKSEIASFYQFIWKLFFLEYLLFPAAYFI